MNIQEDLKVISEKMIKTISSSAGQILTVSTYTLQYILCIMYRSSNGEGGGVLAVDGSVARGGTKRCTAVQDTPH